MKEQIQISRNYDIKPENINFGLAKYGTVLGKNICYERIPITINYGNYDGPLLMKTEKCFTLVQNRTLIRKLVK